MTVSPATIRHYRAEDLEACRELWVELTDWHRDLYDAPDIGGADPGKRFDTHLERVGPDNLWVAVAGGCPVGLVGLIPGDGEAEIEPVVVRASHRGAGVGRALVESAVEAARSRGVRHLCARPVARNAQALRFFRHLGLDIVGHVELFTKLSPAPSREWPPGPELAGRRFRC